MSILLLPEKHVRASESLLGLGAVVLSILALEPKNLDTVWNMIKDVECMKTKIHGSITLDRVILAIDFLFAIGAVSLNSEGLLEHASH